MQLIQQIKVPIRNTKPNMTTAFHAEPDDKLNKIKYSLRRKILQRMNQGSAIFEELSVIETIKESPKKRRTLA